MTKRKVYIKNEVVSLTTRIPEIDAIEFVKSRCDEATLNQIGASGKKYQIEKVAESMQAKESDESIYMSIINSKTGEYLGDFRLLNLKSNKPEIGLVIVESKRNQTYGTNAIKLALDYSKNVLNIRKMYIRVYQNNPKAKSLYMRLGFKDEATADDGYTVNGKKVLEDLIFIEM